MISIKKIVNITQYIGAIFTIYTIYGILNNNKTVGDTIKLANITKTNKTIPIKKYFSASSFGIWYPYMQAEFLVKLEKFARLNNDIGIKTEISPAIGAIGRFFSTQNSAEKSMHLIYKGKVRAIDLYVSKFGAGLTENDIKKVYENAKISGITGFGYYPDWILNGKKISGVHVDNRPVGGNVQFMKPATWRGVQQGTKQIYIPLGF
jgi:hypothetical protein